MAFSFFKVKPVRVNLPTRIDEIISPQVRQAALERAATVAIGRIQRRTSSGVDVDGAAFKPYSPDYKEQRVAAGFSSEPNLQVSGQTLKSMKIVRSSPKESVIGFTGSSPGIKWTKRKRARVGKKTGRKLTHEAKHTTTTVPNALKAKVNDETRHFFGLNADDKKVIVREVRKVLRLKK